MARRKRETSPVEKNLQAVAQHYLERMQKGEKITIATILEELLTALMTAERNLFLQLHPENQANGFYSRTLNLTLGQLNIKVPRVRIGNSFRPSLLPQKWRRVDKDYENLLLALLANGYSRARIKVTLEKLNLPYSEESIEELTNLIYDHLQFYKENPLPQEMFAVFIDAYHGKIRDENGKVGDVSIFTAVGIDMEGYKNILGWWVKKGKENKGFWSEVLQDLISRGLSKVCIFVTDDFKGLGKILKKFFPLSDHQLCLVHLKRNLKRLFGGEVYREAARVLKRIVESQTVDEAQGLWDKLVKVVGSINPKYAKELESKRDNYLAFVQYPEEVRRHVYTTNIVESVNAGLEFMRLELGGYFPSLKSLEANLFIQFSNLNDRWMRKPMPRIRANLYRLHQLMSVKFESEEVIE
jgi:putative transposase